MDKGGTNEQDDPSTAVVNRLTDGAKRLACPDHDTARFLAPSSLLSGTSRKPMLLCVPTQHYSLEARIFFCNVASFNIRLKNPTFILNRTK